METNSNADPSYLIDSNAISLLSLISKEENCKERP
jgi:hypothetical protein